MSIKKERNHEGYHDPTACRAVRRVMREKQKQAGREPLRYRIGEVVPFQELYNLKGQ